MQTKEERLAVKRAYNKANKERISAYNRSYREANKEKIAARQRAHRDANLESAHEKDRAYYWANKEAKIAYNRVWADRNREKRAAYRNSNKWKQKASECRRSGTPFDLPPEFFQNLPSHCPQCGVEFLPPGSNRSLVASIDRDNPALGYVVGNCEWLCGGCNRRKDDQSWTELLAFAVRGMIRKVSR